MGLMTNYKPEEGWKPEHERVGGQALEAPAFSYEDLLGSGIGKLVASGAVSLGSLIAMMKMGGKNSGMLSDLLQGQRGAIGSKVMTPEGEMGRVVGERRIEAPNVAAWRAETDKLHKQAFQGYESGQLDFDQASSIFDTLMQKNADRLNRIRNSKSGEFSDYVRTDTGSWPPKNYPEADVTIFEGPKKIR